LKGTILAAARIVTFAVKKMEIDVDIGKGADYNMTHAR
jgi:hypothetical protein